MKSGARRILSLLWKNLGSFFLALALSIAVWISAVVANDPNEVRTYPRTLALEARGLGRDLVVVNSIPQQVSVDLRAPRSVWDRLSVETGIVRAYLDLAGLPAGEHLLEVQVEVLASPVQVIQSLPVEVPVTLERLLSESIPVSLEVIGEPALGYLRESLSLGVQEVEVSGPESLIGNAASVTGELDISDAREDVVGSVELYARDSDGQVLSGLTLTPSTVEVIQFIRQAGGYRDVAVKVETSGQLASGYRVTNISVLPPTVTIFSSDPLLVAEMPGFVSTQQLNLEGIDGDIETRLSLVLPEGVILVGEEQSVLVQIGVAAIETSVQISVEVETLGLQPGMSATVSPISVDLILSGPLPVLEALRPEDVHVYADLTGLGPGTHLVELRGEILPTGVTIDSLSPGNVQVVIVLGTPTPTVLPAPTATPRPTSTP